MRSGKEIEGRIRERLRALGYWNGGRPDVSRFCREKGYQRQDVHAWLQGRVPRAENLMRLGVDLCAAPAWLLFGDNGMAGWIGAEVRQLLRPKIGGADRARLTSTVRQGRVSRAGVPAAAP
jgi:hypothetical protein